MGDGTLLAQTCNPAATEQLHLNVPQVPPTQVVPNWSHYLLSSLFPLMFLIALNIIALNITVYYNIKARNLKGILDCSLLLISKIQSLGPASLPLK